MPTRPRPYAPSQSLLQKRVLLGFLACGGFSILLQIALVLALLFGFDAVTAKIVDPKEDPQKYKQGA